MSEALQKAINSGNTNQVKNVLESGNTSQKDVALLIAAFKGKVQIVKTLLEMGADPNTALTSKATPLGLSVAFPAIQKLLLEHGANPNQVINANNDTPIFQAISQNKIASIMLLIQAGADLNHENSTGTTPFIIAIEYGMIEICMKMLENGADPNKPFQGMSPLQFVCSSEEVSIPLVKKILEKGANPNYIGDGGRSALHLAAIRRNEELIQVLLEAGADLSLPDSEGRQAIQYAGPLGYLLYPFPGEIESIPLEPESKNSIHEEIKNKNTLALLNPAFPEQRIVVKRNGKVTDGWKYLYTERKNPWTRQAIQLDGLQYRLAVIPNPANTKSRRRKNRKTRKTYKH